MNVVKKQAGFIINTVSDLKARSAGLTHTESKRHRFQTKPEITYTLQGYDMDKYEQLPKRPRAYAAEILKLTTRDQRISALSKVPEYIRDITKIHVINAFKR